MARPPRQRMKSAFRMTGLIMIPLIAAAAITDMAIHHGHATNTHHTPAPATAPHHSITPMSAHNQSSQRIPTTTTTSDSKTSTNRITGVTQNTSSAKTHASPSAQTNAGQTTTTQPSGPNSGGPAGPPKKITDTTVTDVTLNAPDTIYTGTDVQLNTQIRNAIGQLLPVAGHTFVYSITSGPSGGTVSPQGVFHATKTGFYTVQVQVDGSQTGHVTLSVSANVYPMQLTVHVSNNLIAGSTSPTVLEADVVNAQGQSVQGVHVVFSSGNTSLVTLKADVSETDENGIATAEVHAGQTSGSTTLTVRIIPNSNDSEAQTASVPITVNPAPAKIVVSNLPSTLTGNTVNVSVEVLDTQGKPLTGVGVQASTTGTAEVMENVYAFFTSSDGIATIPLSSIGSNGTGTITFKIPGSTVSWSTTVKTTG